MAEQDQNRNEEATPFKKEEARKKGNVAKSMDVNSFVILSVVLASLYIWGQKMIDGQLLIASQLIANVSDVTFSVDTFANFLTNVFVQSLLVLTPFFILLMIFGALSNFLQIGPIFSFFPLKPDLNRINPVTGLKRLFSVKLLIESIKTVLKFILLGSVLYFVIKSMIKELLIAFGIAPSSVGLLMLPSVTSLIFKLLIVMAFIAMLDLMFSRWEYARRLRMSRRDIKDEHKRREGDPRVKSRIKELQSEMLERAKSLGSVKDADVLITNPTHYAVAVKYDREKMEAPIVLAKGAGFLAGRMKDIARFNRVPIVENRPLARSLFRDVSIDQAVPVTYYAALARLLFWVYSLRNKNVVVNS